MLSILPKTPNDIMIEVKIKFRRRRKSLNYSQQELSARTGVSLGSLKRFEQSGQIAFESLLKLALVLECLDDFGGVCGEREEVFGSLNTLLENKK